MGRSGSLWSNNKLPSELPARSKPQQSRARIPRVHPAPTGTVSAGCFLERNKQSMAMTIPQTLQWWYHRLGRSIQFPTIPPACEQMLAQARAAGIPVGKLYIVSRPLAAGSLGTYDRDTGDLCCHYEASLGEKGQREVIQTLLILLAAVKLQAPVPQTIAQEWESMRQAMEEGHALAQQCGYLHVFY